MSRYLEQIACVLRPGSVNGADLALRSFATFLVEATPEVTSTSQVTRRHIEDFKPWLAQRPGRTTPRLTTATLAHRLGTLRMFFVRLDEWGWDEAPARVPMFPGDLPRQDHPLPKGLDDAGRGQAAARSPARHPAPGPGHRRGPAPHRTAGRGVHRLRADAVVHIGAGPWLHVPVGKLRNDRYLPLHPQLVTLIDDYRGRHVPPDTRCCCPARTADRWTGTP